MPDWEAWAAGLFEGEGCVSIKRTPYGRVNVRVSIGSTDRDVLEKFARVFGGRVLGPYEKKPGRKPLYYWGVGGYASLKRIFAAFEPYLGDRRRARFLEVMAMEPSPDDPPGHAMRAKTHCKRGHPLSGPNVYVRTDRNGRECRACSHLRKIGAVE